MSKIPSPEETEEAFIAKDSINLSAMRDGISRDLETGLRVIIIDYRYRDTWRILEPEFAAAGWHPSPIRYVEYNDSFEIVFRPR